ncbi:MAG: DegT/DnrJ/EryC1/StrS aminotransferase family protein [Acidobacteriota bacterium]
MAAPLRVPFFRPDLQDAEIDEVVDTLRSGWLTTGPKTRRFEAAFAEAVGARHALAVNSCTAALHLAVVALGLRAGQGVLVPTLTFAATAEVVRYLGAVPIFVDCDPVTLDLDLADAARKLDDLRAGLLPVPADTEVVGLIAVHVGGLVRGLDALHAFVAAHDLWLVEDAAHAFPAAWRASTDDDWQRCGGGTAAISCFSFYANKTITTGEGGMATSDDSALIEEMRCRSLHGLSRDAWGRYEGAGAPWDYRVLALGYKYNMTDVAAAIGLHQLARANALRNARAAIAARYDDAFAALDDLVERPPLPGRAPWQEGPWANCRHAWHLYPIRLRLDRLSIDRDAVIEQLGARGIGTSVHWRPLHLHPYHQHIFDWTPEHLPVASYAWRRLISLPLFPSQSDEEVAAVIEAVVDVVRGAAR